MFFRGFIFWRAFITTLKNLSGRFEKDPMKEEDLLLEIANSYLKSGKKDKALQSYIQYLAKRPKDARVCYQIANLLRDEEPQTAINYLKRAALLGNIDAIREMKEHNIEE